MCLGFLTEKKDVRFFGLMALLVALESILVIAGALPPMMESHVGHELFFWVRMAVFAAFAWTLAGKPLPEAAKKGGLAALVGVVTQVVFLFIGRSMGKPVLGVAVPSETVLYIALLVSAVINTAFGAVIVAIASLVFGTIKSRIKPKASRPKKRKR